LFFSKRIYLPQALGMEALFSYAQFGFASGELFLRKELEKKSECGQPDPLFGGKCPHKK
jgi:hypothetical protein